MLFTSKQRNSISKYSTQQENIVGSDNNNFKFTNFCGGYNIIEVNCILQYVLDCINNILQGVKNA